MGNFFVYLNDLDFIFKIWILFLIPWSDKGVSVYKPSFVFPMIQEIGKKKTLLSRITTKSSYGL